MDIKNCSPEELISKENEWLKFLEESDSVWNSVPLLNVNDLHSVKNNALVRFKGMIQDMHGPEYYLEKVDVMNETTKNVSQKNGKYIDIITDLSSDEKVNFESPNNVQSERQTFVAISVPALNDWVTEIEEHKYKLINTSSSSSNQSQNKRALDEDNEEMEVDNSSESSFNNNKKKCNNVPSQSNNPTLLSQESLLNFPIPDPKGKVCLLKIYKNAEQLKLNMVCEFVGFLSMDHNLSNMEKDEFLDEMEFQTHNPPPSLIPRLHCVCFKPMLHYNPLIENETTMTTDQMKYLKRELMIVLTQLMCGDDLAAEYLIYHLISEVYLRRDFMALGKFSLNISNIPKIVEMDYVEELYKFLRLLIPKSHFLHFTRENLNKLSFIPKKDYVCNRLTSSILQLSNNTHLVIDETKLTEGDVNEAGLRGVQAISNVIKNQKSSYDFTYYQIEFDCDIPFLLFSEGKCMLPSDCQVPLKPDELHLNTFNEILSAARHFFKPELLNDIRKYLTLARRTNYELNENVQEFIENEFIKMRQENSKTVPDDLHNLLVLTRLICISEGFNTLQQSCWEKALNLEKMRKERLKK